MLYVCRFRLPVIIAAVIVFAGCTTNRTADEKLALEYERAERQASIKAYMNACEEAGRVVYYLGPSRSKLRDPVHNPPKYARLADYRCEDQAAIDSALGVGG